MSSRRRSSAKQRFQGKKHAMSAFVNETRKSGLRGSKTSTIPVDIVSNRLPGWIGDHLTRLENNKKGLIYYNRALELNPHDTKLLVKRAEINGKYCRMDKGMADIKRAQKIDPNNINAAERQLKFMYLNGEFEQSLLLSMKSLKMRRQPPIFSLGVLTAKGAIERCVGTSAGHPLRDHYEIIRELAWLKNMSMEKGRPKRRRRHKKKKNNLPEIPSTHIIGSVKPPKSVRPFMPMAEGDEMEQEISLEFVHKKLDPIKKKRAGFSSRISRFREVPRVRRPNKKEPTVTSLGSRNSRNSKASLLSVGTLQSLASSLDGSLADPEVPIIVPKVNMYPYHPLQRKTTNIQDFVSCSYLGQLFPEKKFLTALPKKPGCFGKNPDTNQTIQDSSKEGLVVLNGTEEILRTRKPFYYIKYQEQLTRSKKVEMDKLQLLERKKIGVIKKINLFFATIARYVKKMDMRNMLKTAEHMYRFCKNTNKSILPDRDSVLCRLYTLLGDGYLFSHKFSPGMTAKQMSTRVNLTLELPVVRTISQESVYRKYKGRGLNWPDLINTYEQRVRACKYSEELIWLYHGLSRFNIEMKRLTLAKTYAGKCIHEARKCENFKWAINGYLLMTKIAVLQKNKNDVRRYLRIAISTARSINDPELDYFLKTCLGVINEWKFENERVEHVLRQRQERILGLISSYEKRREAYLLFEEMSSKPLDRRLPIVPGLIDTDEYDMIERNKEEKRKLLKYRDPSERGIEAARMISGYIIHPVQKSNFN